MYLICHADFGCRHIKGCYKGAQDTKSWYLIHRIQIIIVNSSIMCNIVLRKAGLYSYVEPVAERENNRRAWQMLTEYRYGAHKIVR